MDLWKFLLIQVFIIGLLRTGKTTLSFYFLSLFCSHNISQFESKTQTCRYSVRLHKISFVRIDCPKIEIHDCRTPSDGMHGHPWMKLNSKSWTNVEWLHSVYGFALSLCGTIRGCCCCCSAVFFFFFWKTNWAKHAIIFRMMGSLRPGLHSRRKEKKN